jgi:hypothetical protein
VRNIRTSSFWFQMTALTAALTSSCVENEDKKAPPPPPAEPAAVVPPEPGRAAVSINPAIAYTITTPAGKCLQFSSNQDMAQAEVAPCNGSKLQQFTLQTVAGGYYAIMSADGGRCLDVSAFAMGDNVLVQSYQCNAGQNQNWIVAEGSGGFVRLVARHSGKALSVLDGPDAGTAKVTQLTAGPGVNQRFKINGPGAAAAGGDSGAGGRKGKDAAGKGKKGKGEGKSEGKSAAEKPAKKP